MRLPSVPTPGTPGALAIKAACLLFACALIVPFAASSWGEGPVAPSLQAAPGPSSAEVADGPGATSAGSGGGSSASAEDGPKALEGALEPDEDALSSTSASSLASSPFELDTTGSRDKPETKPGATSAERENPGQSPSTPPSAANESAAAVSKGSSVPGELIVVYDDAHASADASAQVVRTAEASLRVRGMAPGEIIAEPNGYSGTVALAHVADSRPLDDALADLEGAPGIDYAFKDEDLPFNPEPVPPLAPPSEPEPIDAESMAPALPNDPYFQKSGPKNQYYAWQTKVPEAWELSRSEGTVTVAVLDSGCRMSHEDLDGVLDKKLAWDVSTGSKLADRPEDVQDTSPNGHGTPAAGIIAAQANNGRGIAGLSYNAKVLPVKITDDNNKSRVKFFVDGLDYLKQKVDSGELTDLRVVNISWSWATDSLDDYWSLLMRRAIQALRDRGVLTVCSAGNTYGTGLIMPSDAPEAIGVTAVDRNGKYMDYTSYNKYKDIAAPGNAIFSTNKTGYTFYRYFEGTSAASPVVAGIAALIFAADPTLTVDEVVSAIKTTAQPILDTSRPGDGSAGIIDAYRAVKQVKPISVADCTMDPLPDQRYTGSDVKPAVTLRGPDGKTLEEGIDYTLSYAKNRFAGTATVTIEGTGRGSRPFYVGTRTETFTILPTRGNLVLLTRFADDATGDGATGMNAPDSAPTTFPTRWDRTIMQYNAVDDAAGVPASLRTYVSAATAGREDLLSAFPQTRDAGGVAYLTLPHTREHYAAAGDETLVSDSLAALAAFNPSYDASGLDGDEDGVLDNLTILPTTAAPAPAGDPLYPHTGTVASQGLQAGGKRIETYMVIDTASLDAYSVGVAAHALLKRLGAPDLSRSAEQPGTPVGVWDASAAVASPASLPLAVTRTNLGWDALAEKTMSGTYTLSAPGAGGEQAFIFKHPASESEYFVVEYRKKADDAAALDGGIGGSGIIVYRVNPKQHDAGNLGDSDYVYVFRPGETALGAGRGDIDHAQLAPIGAPRNAAGSTDLSQTIADGALCYSNGQNSGAVIRTTGQTADSVTFEITLPLVSEGGRWDSVSNVGGTGDILEENAASIQTATDHSSLYVMTEQAHADGAQYAVRKYDGASWTMLGGPLTGLSGGGRIALCNGELYFIAPQSDQNISGIVVKRFSEMQGAWVDAGLISQDADPSWWASGVVAGKLYVVADDNAHPQLYRLGEKGIEPLGAPLNATGLVAPAIFEMGGTVAIAASDQERNVSSVWRLIGTAWQETVLSDHDSLGQHFSAIALGDKAFVYCSHGYGTPPHLYVLNGQGSLESTAELPQFTYTQEASLVASQTKLYLTLVEGQGNAASAKTFRTTPADPASWHQLGGTVYAPASSVSTTLMGSRLYAGVIDAATAQGRVLFYDIGEAPSIISASVPSSMAFDLDVDADGRFKELKSIGNPSIQNRGDAELVAAVASVRDATKPTSLLDKISLSINAQALREGAYLDLPLGTISAAGGVLPLTLSGNADTAPVLPTGTYRLETTIMLSRAAG